MVLGGEYVDLAGKQINNSCTQVKHYDDQVCNIYILDGEQNLMFGPSIYVVKTESHFNLFFMYVMSHSAMQVTQ